MGADLPKDRVYDGENLLPLFERIPLRRPMTQTFYYYHCENLQAIRSSPWKLHLPRNHEPLPVWDKNKAFASLQTPVLYNLHTGETENTNVASDNPDVVSELLELSDAARQNLGEFSQRGRQQRPTGSLFLDAPVISHQKDWGKLDSATVKAISEERQERHPNRRSNWPRRRNNR